MSKKLLIIIFGVFVGLGANALASERSFGGSISLGGGIRNVDSNISPVNDKKRIQNYNQSNSATDASIIVGLDLYYNLTSDNQLFLKNYNGRDISGLNVGYSFVYGDNKTEVALISTFGEEAYANPYMLDVDREVIDRYKIGGRIGHTLKINELSNIYANYTFVKDYYDKEDLDNSLKREGYINEFEVGYGYGGYSIGLFYDFKNAKGASESYDSYGINIKAAQQLLENIHIKAALEYSLRDYKEANIIFNQTRKTDILKLNATITRDNIFDVKNLYVFASYIYQNNNDDIGFFDEIYNVGLAGFGYRF